jgi:ADP-ribosylation factor GTPase-activating protein 1
MSSYHPPDQGGYKEGATPYDTYHCWAATQYREKVRHISYISRRLHMNNDSARCNGAWQRMEPLCPTTGFKAGSRTASPAPATQGLRKSRASARGGPSRSDTSSPAPSFRSSPAGTPNPAADQKTANENYFTNLGRLNESRPADLPPSQGGRYTGFGSTPTPPSDPSLALSSANAPTLSDLQENPMAALSKGWSLFAAAVVGASKVVNESVIQPGVEKVTDPNFQAGVRGYMTEAQKTAAMVGSTANEWSKQQFGVDVADTVGGAVGVIKDRVAGPSHSGYGQVALTSPNDLEESHSLYQDDDDLFTEYRDSQTTSNTSTKSDTTRKVQLPNLPIHPTGMRTGRSFSGYIL